MFITSYINQQKITKLTLTSTLSIIILSCCASIALGAAVDVGLAAVDSFSHAGNAVPIEPVPLIAGTELVPAPVNAPNAPVPELEDARREPMQQLIPQLIPQQPDTSVQRQDFCCQGICSLLLVTCLAAVYERYTGSRFIMSLYASIVCATPYMWTYATLTGKAMAFARKHQIIS